MKNNITIDIALPSEFQAIAEIYNESIRKGSATMEREIQTAEHIKGWIEKHNPREILYSLKENNTVIAWGIIKKYSDREGYRFACETAIYITESHTRKGLGSKLKLFLIDEARKLNYHYIIAKVFATNIASVKYNVKLGYTIVGNQQEIGFLNGKWLDMTIMQYIIKP